jgi:signal transduction histidine kinase
VEALAAMHGTGESLSELAHDARNMVTALGLYCELLDEPGVLAPQFANYGGELRLLAHASRRLMEKLAGFAGPADAGGDFSVAPKKGVDWVPGWAEVPGGETVANLAHELLASRNLLAALAGPAIALTVDAVGGARPVRMSSEELIRVLVNLVKNAAESQPEGGRIAIMLREHAAERAAEPGARGWLALTVEDRGPGIAETALEAIFEAGFSSRGQESHGEPRNPGTRPGRRGLGLSIVRSIVVRAGGKIYAENRNGKGARLVVELPIEGRAGG